MVLFYNRRLVFLGKKKRLWPLGILRILIRFLSVYHVLSPNKRIELLVLHTKLALNISVDSWNWSFRSISICEYVEFVFLRAHQDFSFYLFWARSDSLTYYSMYPNWSSYMIIFNSQTKPRKNQKKNNEIRYKFSLSNHNPEITIPLGFLPSHLRLK